MDTETKDRGAVRVGPGEGRAVRMPGAQLVTCKVRSDQTGGAYSLFEVEVGPRGGGQSPYVQHRADECFWVLEGEFEFVDGGGATGAGPGTLIYVPKGALRAFKNVGSTTGRLLVSQTPGGLHERFFEEVGEEGADGHGPFTAGEPPRFERLATIGAEYGIEMVPLPPP